MRSKLFDRFFSFFLLFFFLTFSLVHPVRVQATSAALTATEITNVADYVIGEGLIGTGVTFAAPVLIGLTAAGVVGYAVNDYVNNNPSVFNDIKNSVSSAYSSGVASAVNLSDSAWNSIRSYAQSKYTSGTNTLAPDLTLDSSVTSTFSFPSTYNGYPLVASFITSSGTTIVVYARDGYCYLSGSNVMFNPSDNNIITPYYYCLDSSGDGESVASVTGFPISVNATISSNFTYGSSFYSAVPVSYSANSAISNSTYDFVNPTTNTRAVPTPSDVSNVNLGSLVGVQASSFSTAVSTSATTTSSDSGILQGLWDWLKGILNSILSAINSIPSNITSSTTSIIGGIGSIVGAIGSETSSITGQIGNSIGSLTGNVMGGLGTIEGEIGSTMGSIGSAAGSITGQIGSSIGNLTGNVMGGLGIIEGIIFNTYGYLQSLPQTLATDIVGNPSSLSLAPLQVVADSLTTKFPFSAPWDIKYLYSLFLADPVAPHFTSNFQYGNLNLGKFDFDFSVLNDFMAFVRWFEFIGVVFVFVSRGRSLMNPEGD